MKIALLLNDDNFRRYAAAETLPEDFELIMLGNGQPDEDKIAATDADMLVVDPILPITADLIDRMPNLKIIQSQGVACNQFDLAAARAHGIDVCNNAGANAGAVAEQAILLMLSVLRNIKENDRMVFEARQAEAKGRCFKNGIRELSECHVGLVGLGAIGKATAKLLQAFGCRISYYNRTPRPESGLEYMPLEQLLSECDIISLHTAVTPNTENIINKETLAIMQPGSILINTARGELVDQEALCEALISGHLSGAGLDTLTPEPVTADNPLLNLPEEVRDRVIMSPHIAGITAGSFKRYFRNIWRNAKLVAAGEKPVNIVN